MGVSLGVAHRTPYRTSLATFGPNPVERASKAVESGSDFEGRFMLVSELNQFGAGLTKDALVLAKTCLDSTEVGD